MKKLVWIYIVTAVSFLGMECAAQSEDDQTDVSNIELLENIIEEAGELPKTGSLESLGVDLMQLPLGVFSSRMEFAAGRNNSIVVSPRIKLLAIFKESRFVSTGLEYRQYLSSKRYKEGFYLSAFGSLKYYPSLSLMEEGDSENWKRSTAFQIGALTGFKKDLGPRMYMNLNTGLVYRSRLLHSERGVVSRPSSNYESFFVGDDVLAEKVIQHKGILPKLGFELGIRF